MADDNRVVERAGWGPVRGFAERSVAGLAAVLVAGLGFGALLLLASGLLVVMAQQLPISVNPTLGGVVSKELVDVGGVECESRCTLLD